jgi:hypothetical protein
MMPLKSGDNSCVSCQYYMVETEDIMDYCMGTENLIPCTDYEKKKQVAQGLLGKGQNSGRGKGK